MSVEMSEAAEPMKAPASAAAAGMRASMVAEISTVLVISGLEQCYGVALVAGFIPHGFGERDRGAVEGTVRV
jgi:hypothetical protein